MEWQLKIRDMSKNDLVHLIEQYREQLENCMLLLREYAEQNLALKDVKHKIYSAMMAENIRMLLKEIEDK